MYLTGKRKAGKRSNDASRIGKGKIFLIEFFDYFLLVLKRFRSSYLPQTDILGAGVPDSFSGHVLVLEVYD